MTALPKEIAALIDRLEGHAQADERCGRSVHDRSQPRAEARAALESAILADRERLAAESEARRLVLALKATELRQERLRAERAEEALRGMLLSADCEWENRRQGHDWAEACQAARAVLSPLLSPLPAPQPAPKVKP